MSTTHLTDLDRRLSALFDRLWEVHNQSAWSRRPVWMTATVGDWRVRIRPIFGGGACIDLARDTANLTEIVLQPDLSWEIYACWGTPADVAPLIDALESAVWHNVWQEGGAQTDDELPPAREDDTPPWPGDTPSARAAAKLAWWRATDAEAEADEEAHRVAQDEMIQTLSDRGFRNVRVTSPYIPTQIAGDLPDGRYFEVRGRHERVQLRVWGHDDRVNHHPEDFADTRANQNLPHQEVTRTDVPQASFLAGADGVAVLDTLLAQIQ